MNLKIFLHGNKPKLVQFIKKTVDFPVVIVFALGIFKE